MQSRAFLSAILVILGLGGVVACGSSRKIKDVGDQVVSTCTSCHGGLDNQTGAPPTDLSGRSDPSLASVGAHTAHVQAGLLSTAFDCSACHPKPAEVVAPLHADGIVQVTFGPASSGSGALTPSYDRQRLTCASVYCHGGFPEGNPNNQPVWTGGATQARCGTCHGNPSATASALPTVHVALVAGSTNATCNICHPMTVKADGTIDAAGGKHVNGQHDVDPAAKHPSTWMAAPYNGPGFHGAQASAACFRCHAASAPARVTTLTCNYCHDMLGLHITEP